MIFIVFDPLTSVLYVTPQQTHVVQKLPQRLIVLVVEVVLDMGMLDVFDKLAEYEDEQTASYLSSHYGPLVQMSCVYPSYKRSILPITLATFAWHTIFLLTHLILLVFSVQRSLVYWDLKTASLSFHFIAIIIFVLFSIYFVPFQRELYFRQTKLSANDVAIYRSGRIYDEDWCVKQRKKIEKEKKYFLALPALIGIGVGIVMTVPYSTRLIQGAENPYTRAMVNEVLPIPCWYPFPTHEGALHWIASACQILAASSAAILVITLLLYFLVNSQNIKYELRVVGYSMKTLFSRSTKLYLQMNPKKNRADVQVWDPAYQRVVGICIIDSVIHHLMITELVSYYAGQLDVLGFLAIVMGTAIIGMSLFNILKALNESDAAGLILFSILLVCETLVMLILSALGEQITQESIELRNQLYYSKWHNLDTRNRRILLNFHTAMTEPIKISAMGLIDFSLDTFSSIMNTAYSFFNLMNSQPGQ